MRRFAGTVALVFPFLAVVACGGRVGVIGGGDGGGGGTCPLPSVVASGAACTSAGQTCAATFTACGTPESADCTCTDGTWACPAFAGPACVVACPPTNGVEPGSSCDLATQSPCTVELTSTACDGSQLTGVCSCQSDGEGSAAWACTQPVEPECADAQPPGCPDPQSVEHGISCLSPGLQCPGNPTECDGAVFYDAFECDDGVWNDIAVTGCSGSGSSGGGGGSSGGGGSVDAGPPDAKGI